MGFWHGVEYYEKERVVGDEFYQQWNNVSAFHPAIIILRPDDADRFDCYNTVSFLHRYSRKTLAYRTIGRSSWRGQVSRFR